MDSRLYFVGFNKIRGIGSVRLQRLIDCYGSIEEAWNAPAKELFQTGIGSKIITSLIETRQNLDLTSEMQKIHENGIQVVTWDDQDYPRHLKEIDQPPPILFYKGTLDKKDDWAVAIVGTRQKTSYGKQVTDELARFLALNHITVVSGLARGIDSVAHEACIDAGGRTYAVLGCGVDQIYPPEHRHLAEKIIQNGAIISEYAPGTPPDGINFPPRNRIISGLSLASVIVEAGETSGAMITATFAVNQGREVFAVPGNIYSPKSKGTNRLIRDGAQPLLDFNQILEVLDLDHLSDYHYAQAQLPENELEKSLFETLIKEPLHIDEIQVLTSMPIEKISATLVIMELKGMIKQVSPMTYFSVKEDAGIYG